MPDSWTVLRLLTWTTDYLKSHGSESPRLEAEVLLAHARNCERISLGLVMPSDTNSAATPVTCGAAMDVPDMGKKPSTRGPLEPSHPFRCWKVSCQTWALSPIFGSPPGAAISTSLPHVE